MLIYVVLSETTVPKSSVNETRSRQEDNERDTKEIGLRYCQDDMALDSQESYHNIIFISNLHRVSVNQEYIHH